MFKIILANIVENILIDDTFKLMNYVTGVYLKETVKYSFFLKVWYNENTFAIFKSDGVTIATQRPSVTNKLGSAVSQLDKF